MHAGAVGEEMPRPSLSSCAAKATSPAALTPGSPGKSRNGGLFGTGAGSRGRPAPGRARPAAEARPREHAAPGCRVADRRDGGLRGRGRGQGEREDDRPEQDRRVAPAAEQPGCERHRATGPARSASLAQRRCRAGAARSSARVNRSRRRVRPAQTRTTPRPGSEPPDVGGGLFETRGFDPACRPRWRAGVAEEAAGGELDPDGRRGARADHGEAVEGAYADPQPLAVA